MPHRYDQKKKSAAKYGIIGFVTMLSIALVWVYAVVPQISTSHMHCYELRDGKYLVWHYNEPENPEPHTHDEYLTWTELLQKYGKTGECD